MFVRKLRLLVIRLGQFSFDTLVASGVTPNQVTMVGLALVVVNCVAYLWFRDMFVLGCGLSLAYAFDALDGAVARRRGMATAFGGYLDSVIDRYQEISAYLVVGIVRGWWLAVYLVTIGSILVSYTKAAAAIQMPIDNKSWPDLMERPRRMWIFCAALILDNALPVPQRFGGSLTLLAIWFLVILTHFTALQRIMRARRLLIGRPLP